MPDRILRRAGAKIAGLTVLLLALVPACSDDPTEDNAIIGALPIDEMTVRDTVLTADSSGSFKIFTAMNGQLNLLGQDGGYAARMLVQFFNLPQRDTILVYSATLNLTSVTWSGDPAGPFGFTAHRIEVGWNPDRVTWDTVATGFFESAVARGSYSGGTAPDTQTISVELDTALVRGWLRPTSSGGIANYGLLLEPSPSTRIVRGFYAIGGDSASWHPSLRVIAGNVAGTTRDTATYSTSIDSFVGNIDNLVTDPTVLYAQAGVNYRSALRFPLGSIPRGAIINRAELLLENIPGQNRLTRFTADTAVSAHVRFGTDPGSAYEADFLSAVGRKKAGSTFSFDVRHAVQSWLRGPNLGLLLRPVTAAERSSFDLYVFAGPSAADPALRPRILLTYSYQTPPGQR